MMVLSSTGSFSFTEISLIKITRKCLLLTSAINLTSMLIERQRCRCLSLTACSLVFPHGYIFYRLII